MTIHDKLVARLRSREERWLWAYYYSFDSTGVAAIDNVLAAVALAGKGAHSTSEWGEPSDYYSADGCPNMCAVDLIQGMANYAAECLKEMTQDRDALRVAFDAAQEELLRLRGELDESPSNGGGRGGGDE